MSLLAEERNWPTKQSTWYVFDSKPLMVFIQVSSFFSSPTTTKRIDIKMTLYTIRMFYSFTHHKQTIIPMHFRRCAMIFEPFYTKGIEQVLDLTGDRARYWTNRWRIEQYTKLTNYAAWTLCLYMDKAIYTLKNATTCCRNHKQVLLCEQVVHGCLERFMTVVATPWLFLFPFKLIFK